LLQLLFCKGPAPNTTLCAEVWRALASLAADPLQLVEVPVSLSPLQLVELPASLSTLAASLNRLSSFSAILQVCMWGVHYLEIRSLVNINLPSNIWAVECQLLGKLWNSLGTRLRVERSNPLNSLASGSACCTNSPQFLRQGE